MVTKRLLITITILVLAQSAQAQFGTNQSQSNRLLDLAGRLSREASDFAASTYRTYSNSFRSNRSDVEALMLTEQFSAATQVFYRMANDRRRAQDLRDAFGMVQELARSVERTNVQRNTWNNVQRLMADVNREIEQGGGSSDGGNYPIPGQRGGRMTWKGKVDDDVRIIIRGGQADVETIGGTPYYDAQQSFSASLPPRRATVTLTVKRSRGQVYIEQQPSRENDYATVIRIKDPRGGASDYEFEISW
jgi:hypothetical protein